MPLLPTTLADGLKTLQPVNTEAEGINNFMTAWENYFKLASVAGIPTATGTLTPYLNAMRGALTGIGQQDAAATKLQTAITAFWGSVCGAAATIWVTVPPVISATPPPALGSIAATLNGVFAANISGELPLDACATAIANALHTLMLGGIAVQQAPPAPPVNTPIL